MPSRTVDSVPAHSDPPVADRYKWIALSNTTLGMVMASINSSITLIALPNIFDGIHLNPLLPSSSGYLLWMLMGFMVVTAVLVVTLGRIGDIYGRVRLYNLGFAVFTVFSILLSVTWWSGPGAALYLIAMRVGQGVGAACLMANSSAILTDAFPENERGMAIGMNAISVVVGSFIGLVLGGVLAPIEWHLVFLVSVPFGLFGTVWAYLKLRDQGARRPAPIDWWGNATFAVGLVAVLAGITYGIMPYGHHVMGWTNPRVLGALIGGVALLGLFGFIETRVAHPMFQLELFRTRAFSAGNFAGFLGSLGRGGLMFLLILWLQGVWLPLHGYDFTRTPLWAGIYMLPLTAGMLVAAPLSGVLSDRFGARPFATAGMAATGVCFVLLTFLPVDFSYPWFALILLVMGLAMGIFAAPNRAGIMNSLPPDRRGAGAGMATTFQNSAQVLSIGVFFSLIIAGLSSSLPGRLFHGLVVHGVPAATATQVSHLPPVASLFAAFLGYNPMKNLLGPTLGQIPPAQATFVTGRRFFPQLISGSFQTGLHEAFYFAAGACVLAAVASWMRGKKVVGPAVRSSAAEPAGEEVLVSFESLLPVGVTEDPSGD
ncbi:MAG: MFS transporter [Acidobacteriota bacterium]|nr:MFS transporter [Acidobacteriota bacterium]